MDANDFPDEGGLRRAFEREGRVWFRDVLGADDLAAFDAVGALPSKAGQRLQASAPLARALAPMGSLRTAIARLDERARPVRVVAFNKSDDANWGVPWHQDRVIAVTDRADVPGFHNWSKKSAVWHCEPPRAILDGMLFVRVYLDDTDRAGGAMEIALGSHAKGLVPSDMAAPEAEASPREICAARRGDVLVLKMLTLHASKPADAPGTRRVLRIDFAAADLPPPLSWTDFGGAG